jgi:alpha-L-arabinofuranosidase
LALFVVNRDPSQALVTEIRVEGFRAAAAAEVITLAGKSFMDVNTFEAPTSVHPVASTASVSNGTIRHTFPPASLTRIVLKRGRAR